MPLPMDEPVTRLYPTPALERPLEGLYLEHGIHRLGSPGQPFVYSNFIMSLDGRISEPSPDGGRRVPAALANGRDWHLYLELAAQAEVVVTTARHLRAVTEQGHGDPLGGGRASFTPFADWRESQGLPRYPDLAVLGERLDFAEHEVAQGYPGRRLVVTSEHSDPSRRQALEQAGYRVMVAAPGPDVPGAAVCRVLGGAGYARIYSIGGPGVLHSLLQTRTLSRLYLTLAQVVLGGDAYDTVARGGWLDPAASLTLHSAHLDPVAPAAGGQLFLCYERAA